MSKAYDRMEWDFICETLDAVGFQNEFIQIIRELMTSVYYSIILNESPFGIKDAIKD